jgi:hypothetical protein
MKPNRISAGPTSACCHVKETRLFLHFLKRNTPAVGGINFSFVFLRYENRDYVTTIHRQSEAFKMLKE